jgi:hypothetical protein
VAGTVALVPGATGASGAIGDLRAMNDQLLRTTSTVPRPGAIWLATDDPSTVAAVLERTVPDGARVTTVSTGSGDALLRPVVVALWIGSAGALLLAAAALAAVASALARARRPDIVALRALGVSDAQQAHGRQGELVGVVAFAVLLGVGGGILISALTVGDLARSAVLDAPRGLPATLQFDLVPGLILLAALAAVVAGIVVAIGAGVRRQAAASTGRELES